MTDFETMKPLQPQSEILDVKIAQTLDDMYLYTDDEKYHVAQIRVLIEAEVTRRVVEELEAIKNEAFRLYKLQFSDETMPDRTLTQAESEVLHRRIARAKLPEEKG